jgi:tetratricopeptide (TPR) repeat protein
MRCHWLSRPNGFVYIGMVALVAFALPQSSIAAQQAVGGKAPVPSANEIAIGSRVVLKSSNTALENDGTLVSTGDQFALGVEKIDGNRLFLASKDRKIKGWVNRDQVVPYDLALDYFNNAITRKPNDADAHWMRGQLWFYRSEYDRSLNDVEQAIRLGPDQAKFHILRGRAFDSKREFDKALTEWTQAIGLDPKNATAYDGRARFWRRKRDYKRAIADLDEALRLDPMDAYTWSDRSYCWRNEGNFENALRDINEAIRLAPTSNIYYTNRSQVWEMKEEHDKALVDLNESIRLNPKDHFAYGFRAYVWGQKHDRDKEIADYSEAIKLDPHYLSYRTSRALAWSRRGMHHEAIADFDEIIRLTPNSASAYIDRGVEWSKDALAGQVAPDRAIADFTRAIELDPKSGDAYHFRARAFDRKHEYAKAMRDWSEYARLEESDPSAQSRYARRLATSKDASVRDGKRAVQVATRACELSKWKDVDCVDTLAAAYAETGDFPTAIKWETLAIEFIKHDLFHVADTKEFRMRDRLKLYQKQQPYRE